ncbi:MULTISPECIES: hypothetical protein [unclassified Pseudomonas]|uniref:hypothetical protein n=1 Tax=unclassified Pseudomonas TaxID=196821 RepID=UPI00160ED0AC|nr:MULTISPECIES: hypothetical protein [unclassified Pseudomonas]MBB6287052.1 hypothetical protein [Pseudomonas sp. SJZ073]MBB6311022.1 hypothetical protein [Pseudomonas sp. JAI120]
MQAPHSIAHAVSARFADRPTLDSVIRQQLATAIGAGYPSLSLDLSRTRLARPQRRGWLLQPFMQVVHDALASGVALDFSDVNGSPWYLSDEPPKRLKLPGVTGEKLDMQVIATLVDELPRILPIALQNALTEYWDSGPWRWLAGVLRDTLRISALSQASLDPPARETLEQLLERPDREARIARHGANAVIAYSLEATLTTAERSVTLIGPQLALVRAFNGKVSVLLCSPEHTVETFESMDALIQAYGQQLSRRYQVDDILIQRYEPDGDPFEHQASMILNRQLEDLGSLRLPTGQPFSTWQALYADITDPGRFLRDAPAAPARTLDSLRQHLPTWLRDASSDDQATYRRYTLALAGAKRRAAGRNAFSDIDDLRTYTVNALLQALQQDAVTLGMSALTPPSVAALHPDDLQLSFAIAAGYPGTAGIIRHERMSLTDLAIDNVSSRPSGSVTLTHRLGLPLPAWLTADYLMGADGPVARADIGQYYPRLLETHLLGESAEARQRETLFAEQQAVQLPLLALELNLKQQAGLSATGARLVAALMEPDAANHRVDQRPVVIRHLALLRTPGAQPDTVTAMYLIEAEDIRVGPHVLYRPLYAEALQEFASRRALFEAIAESGPLQDGVLTWLSDKARPIYANGGFREPHSLRFGQGDEFAPLSKPAPATLSVDGINDELQQCRVTGRLMSYLYSDHARALVEQANRESVSNSEGRWQVLREGSSLLFGNLLLPLLRGPAMLTGWLWGLMASLDQDIPALASQDPQTRELATVDLLLNLGLLLLEAVPVVIAAPSALEVGLKDEALPEPLAPWIAEQWPLPPPPRIREGAVILPGAPAQTGKTLLDLSFTQARQRLTTIQRSRLTSFRAPRPTPLPQPVLNGPRRGLYLVENTWHALVEDEWLQVALEPEGDIRVVMPGDATHHGPYLRSESDGTWSVDMRLRLRGGMPPKRIAAERQRQAQRISELKLSFEQFIQGQAAQQSRIDIILGVMTRTDEDPRFSETQRADSRQRFDTALQEQTQAYQQQLDSLQERSALGIALPPQSVASLLENIVNNARKHVVVAEKDRTALYHNNSRFTVKGARLAEAVLTDFAAYREFIRAMTAINERSAHWLERRDRYLDQLFSLGDAGAEYYKRLTWERPQEISALAVKALLMRNYELMTHKHPDHPLVSVLIDILEPLQEHLRTHSDLNDLELSAEERINVLESLVEHYGRGLDSLQGVGIVNADELDGDYFPKLVTLVRELYQEAARQLASEIKPIARPPRRPNRRSPTAVGRPQKKVIRTPKKGTFIGEVKPLGTLETVEVRSEVTGEVLGTYAQRGEQWIEFKESVLPTAAPAPRSLSLVKGEARKLLAMLEEHLKRGDQYMKISRHPEEVQEVLQHESVRYDKLANELYRAIQAQPAEARTPADQTLERDMRQAAVRLNERGLALRIQLCLELPPTHGNLEFLIEQKRANMALLGERIQLSGDRRDFVQEYAVNDQGGYPLWYAHFHYPAADTPKQNYTAAHLKIREQRRVSYYSQLARAQSPQAVVDVHRGLIGKALAERWFLPLAS